ncbi:MAG: 2-amino-4-hydroxy-6-hydroxymethyldihydropteridine diphosphokinase [Mariprofundales bacterium]
MSVEALIALGGNLGDVGVTLVAARRVLAQLPMVSVTASSSIYQTAAIGPGEQPDYLNAAVVVDTGLAAATLLSHLHAIEAQFGRERGERWGARTLDLDLLAYGDRCCDDAALQLPHPRMAERLFVLAPLVEVAAEWIHPHLGITVRQMERKLLDAVGETNRVSRVDPDCGWY